MTLDFIERSNLVLLNGKKVDKNLLVANFLVEHYCALRYNNAFILQHYDWLVGCFGFNGPLRQYFSLYRAVSQREGERGQIKDR